jgi:isoleucyl-tRNA synthetase
MTKTKHYPEPNQDFNFAKAEEEILKFWQENKIFEKSIANRDYSNLEETDSTSPAGCCVKGDCDKHAEKNNEFVFYDGPPFANGLPHYGHLLTGYIKDIFARYQTIKGKKVERKFGWDTHGLPVEMEVEKELGVSGQIAIKEYGIGKFNEACKTSVMKYAGEWENYVSRQGRWVDFKDGYKTMDVNYMESVLWAFGELYKKGLMYEDLRVVPYSWACQTPLSNFETRMDNSYRRKESKAVTVKFELEKTPEFLASALAQVGICNADLKFASNNKKDMNIKVGVTNPDQHQPRVFLLAWTTTPWTLPSNLALAVGKDIDYVAARSHPPLEGGSNQLTGLGRGQKSDIYILAESCVEKYKKEFGEIEIIKKLKGSDLLKLNYKPLFPYFEVFKEGRVYTTSKPGYVLPLTQYRNCFTILHGDFVSTEDGTGIVHMAPGFGEDDQLLCKANNIPTICPVDEGGKFANIVVSGAAFNFLDFNYQNQNLPNLKGRQVFETNDDIIKYLKAQGSWLKTEQYFHNYPHCWRTDTPLIYKAVPSWYVEVTKIRDQMVANNQQINWIPDNIKDGQFGKWLEGARDWSISRNRFWGCPVPVWKSNDPTYPRIDVYGSLAEMEKDFGRLPMDAEGKVNLHRPFIDDLTRPNPNDPTGKSTMVRVTDVLDCWFESGSMPYAQCHYPFENKEWFENNFPADFITEYLAQTRGWFYTLMVLSTALFGKPPFKNVICHGTILDENSQKLSKRLKNYADPLEIFAEYGSDAMRFYMISQPVMKGQELRIDKEGKAIRDTLRLAIKPLINAYNFFCLYANSDGIKAEKISNAASIKNIMDRYILAKLKSAVLKIDQAMENYDTPTACNEFTGFFEVLNNWYIRRSRNRFWKSEIDEDKTQAYNTLYTVLLTMCEACSPLLPFTAEKVWKDLTKF